MLVVRVSFAKGEGRVRKPNFMYTVLPDGTDMVTTILLQVF